jgi:hypothetical protein
VRRDVTASIEKSADDGLADAPGTDAEGSGVLTPARVCLHRHAARESFEKFCDRQAHRTCGARVTPHDQSCGARVTLQRFNRSSLVIGDGHVQYKKTC